MDKWQARLAGDEYALETLTRQLTQDNLRVIKEGDNYFITSSNFDALDEIEEVEKRTEQLMKLLGGILRHEFSHLPKIRVDGYRKLRDDGTRQWFVTGKVNVQLAPAVSVSAM